MIMKNRSDREFRSPPEHLYVPEESMPKVPEFRNPDEIFEAYELIDPAAEFAKTAFGDAEAAEETQKKAKRVSLMKKIITAAAAATVTFSSLGLNLFGLPQLSFFGSDNSDMYYETEYITESEPEPDEDTETEEGGSETDEGDIPVENEEADSGFPELANLKPNGSVPGYGVLDEEYILVEGQSYGTQSYIYAGLAYYTEDENGEPASPVTGYNGIEYDEDANTLTLSNCTAEILNINMMGNGLKIVLEGDNRFDHILIWGFHYGGSVTITGSGSLSVNADQTYDAGILLRGEESQTCLMIDSGVNVEAYGAKYAILVEATSMEKAIYYLPPLTLSSGTRRSGYYLTSSGDYKDYTIVDENGAPLTHVKFE